jgi:hypothetical protein
MEDEMEKKINVLFRLRKDQPGPDNTLPVYLRVTIEGHRFEWSTKRYVQPAKWSFEAGKVKGQSDEAKAINEYLEVLKHKVFVYQRELILEQKELTIKSFKCKWLGITENSRMILDVFQNHNEKVKKLLGRDFAAGTLERYKTSLDHTQRFIQWKYKAEDLDISKLDYEFIGE